MFIPSPCFLAIVEEFSISLNSVAYTIGGAVLSYGVASLWWVACGNRFGARTTFVTSSFLAGVFCIWGAVSPSFAQLVAARTLASALFASPETLGPQALGDIYFLNERATVIGLLSVFQGSGVGMGPLAAAFITQSLGWRWIEWVCAILSFCSCIMIFVFLPETQYARTAELTHTRQRSLLDGLRFWNVSGGGPPKVKR